jgi:hypothetical protein
VLFERQYYWRGFVPESTGNSSLFGIELRKVKSVTTDGGENMCGSKTGVLGRICKEVMQVGSETPMVFHCIIHQEVLCCQILSLKDVMDIVI